MIYNKGITEYKRADRSGRGESLKTSIERDEEIRKMQKQIEKLQGKLKKERQLNRQLEIHAQIKSLRKELEEKQ